MLDHKGEFSHGRDAPTATATPPGISARQRFPADVILVMVVAEKSTPAPMAHSLAIGGSPFPVTSLAVKIQT